MPWRAHGTDATTTPCLGPLTRGASGLQDAPQQAQIRAPPVPPALPVVIAWAVSLALSATLLRALTRTDRDHDRLALIVELDVVDHGRLLDPEHAGPCRGVAHAVPRSKFRPQTAQNLDRDGVLHVQAVTEDPRKRLESLLDG